MSSAILSPCGLYRYRLDRVIDPLGLGRAGRIAWIMVNPSTADATRDDATIRKVIGFSLRAGFAHLTVGNLFAYRATDIRALGNAADPIGPDNSTRLLEILAEADKVVVAWGALAKLPEHLRGVWYAFTQISNDAGRRLHCLGVTADGQPRHPLMVAYATELQPWTAP